MNAPSFQNQIVFPGQEIASVRDGYMAGKGTYEKGEMIISSLLGEVIAISKLITVVPQKSPYSPEVGDVVIGRITNVDKKNWKLDINGQRDAILNLTAINLPTGEQRIRNEEDQMQMRKYFEENDLLSGEIQQINQNGLIHIQTRNLKYGKLKNGLLIKVNHILVKKKKKQFIDLIDNIKAILGINGLVWVYYSTVNVEDEYFIDDKNKNDIYNKEEQPDYHSCCLIVMFANIIKYLNQHDILIIRDNIIKYYEIFINNFRKNINKENKSEYKKLCTITQSEDLKIIDLFKEQK